MPSETLRVVLGSSSIYRRELLARLGFSFEVASPGIDESALPEESPRDTAQRLARQKAHSLAPTWPNALVIGCDQVAVCNGESVGKPGNHQTATLQLARLRNQRVTFHSALCLFDTRDGTEQYDTIDTVVQFRNLSDAQIEEYLQREKPYDCAGSAKAEGLGIALMQSILSDDPTALIGLPLIRLVTMLGIAGFHVLSGVSP